METAASLQKRLLQEAKEKFGFNVQVVCSLVRAIARISGDHVSGTTTKFNIPRNCKIFRTSGFFFVELGMYPFQRLAVPIKRNKNQDRFFGLLGSGWSCRTFGLTPGLETIAYLSKKDPKFIPQRNILAVDVNAKNFAYSVLTPEGQILNQSYLGQNTWIRQNQFGERRSLFQSLGTIKKLKRMRRHQRNYAKTSVGQLVRKIITIAKKYEA
jgi:hypothetical protein